MNSSGPNSSENKDTNQANTESSNIQGDSKEQDSKNIESLFESQNFLTQSSDDDLMSLFANSEMIEEANADLFSTPEMMSMGEKTELFNTAEIGDETSEMDLFDTPEMIIIGEETDILLTPEIMLIGSEFDSSQSPAIGDETSEMDLFNTSIAAQTNDGNQLVEVIAIESQLDLELQPEVVAGDSNLGLGLKAISTATSIPLLEERLIVNISKQKIGEIVVRKEIEIEMVQVPIRREKLIVEQVGAETIQLAKIDLGQSEIQGVELATNQTNIPQAKPVAKSNEMIVEGEFTSAKIASLLLNAIALERRQGCKKIRVEIVVDDAERQKTYQEWVDRCSVKPSH